MSALLHDLVGALDGGSVEIVDLTHPLGAHTPVIELPEPFVDTPGFRLHELSRYDERGPAWYWNAFEGAEHCGTHFDAPVHWVTGKEGDDVASIPVRRLIGPAVVIDKTAEVERDADTLFTVEDVMHFQDEHGELPPGGFVLFRTGWSARSGDRDAFLLTDERGPHWPGPSPELARWLAAQPIAGIGSECVGIDAGAAHAFDPIYPAHHYLLGAGKYGLASLGNLDRLPPTGALVIAAPLAIVGGSGSPMRCLALTPR